jgi:phenylalanine-4-hydroxylase
MLSLFHFWTLSNLVAIVYLHDNALCVMFGLHPETEYRKRRSVLASLAKGFRNLDPVPIVTYTEEENKTWGLVYNRLLEAQGRYACAEYLSIMPLMQAHCGYCAEKIPQVKRKACEID